jgi:uncharacterized protein (DUF433 family)
MSSPTPSVSPGPVAPHIRLDARGVALIDDTRYKVIHIVEDHLFHGWSPEEIAYQHYHDLSLAQIFAALAYYYDNRAAFDAEIKRQAQEAEQLRSENLESPVRQKLRAMGLLP